MLGEKIGDFQSRITGQRALPADGTRPKFETTADGHGQILGVPARIIATYWSVVLPDGTLYGECPGQAVTMTQDGDTAVFRAGGAGRFGPGGAVSFRGAVYYQGATGKLARLNGMAAVYEWDVAADGSARFSLWEWK
jgi:hypothetical protein